MIGYMYILECSDGSYYTGSTNNLELRLQQHQNGEELTIQKNAYL
jgi:putative endonuclease